MKIIGIDPGIATTGYGIIEKKGNKFNLIAYGAILTKAHQPLENRLFQLSRQLKDVICEHSPTHMSVEELFFNTNTSTAMIVAQARGVILLTGHETGVSISEYTPLQVKVAVCGYGRADKQQVQYMVRNLLNLEFTPKPDDAADALAVAICHAHSHKLDSLKILN